MHCCALVDGLSDGLRLNFDFSPRPRLRMRGEREVNFGLLGGGGGGCRGCGTGRASLTQR